MTHGHGLVIVGLVALVGISAGFAHAQGPTPQSTSKIDAVPKSSPVRAKAATEQTAPQQRFRKSSSGEPAKNSDKLQNKVEASEKATSQQAGNATVPEDAARDRKKATADNVKKFIDTSKNSNPKF